MEPKTSLKDLNGRIAKLEPKVASLERSSSIASIPGLTGQRNTVEALEARKKEIQNQQLEALKAPFFEKVKTIDTSSGFTKLKTLAVQFVEEIAPRVAMIVGFAISGQFKMDLVIDLLKAVAEIIPTTIVDEIEEVVYLLFNKDKDQKTIQAASVLTETGQTKKKQGCFHKIQVSPKKRDSF